MVKNQVSTKNLNLLISQFDSEYCWVFNRADVAGAVVHTSVTHQFIN